MELKDVKKKDIEYAKKIFCRKELSWDSRMKTLMNYFDKSERSVRRWLIKFKISTKHFNESSKQYEEAKKKKIDKRKRIFFITWAQNNTPIHKPFFDNMKAYADRINASILCIPGRYKNPTSVFSDRKEDFWVEDIIPYLNAGRHDIHKYVTIFGDIKISPTAMNPMTGLNGLSHENTCVFGHPKVQFETIPGLPGHRIKMMFTTGAVTRKNYTDSKAGKKGEFHHILGFVVVEIDDEDKNEFHIRQVTANKNGNFKDLHFSIKDGVVEEGNTIEAIVLGDLHLGDENPLIMKTTKDIIKKYKPKHVVCHDIFDGKSINHHEKNDPIRQYRNEVENKNNLKKEIKYMLDWIGDMEKRTENLVIVRGNHDYFVDRYIIERDWKKDIKNSVEYMKYATVLLEDKARKGIIPWIINQKYPNVITLGDDSSYMIKGFECGQHAHKGANGTRGTINGFRKLNVKMILGHTHSPARKDNVIYVGTSTHLRLGYNRGGPSSWLNSHVIIHSDGKAQHILMSHRTGKYTSL